MKQQPIVRVQPQRKQGGNWAACEPHQAQRFALVEFRTGSWGSRTKIIQAFNTAAEANKVCSQTIAHLERRHRKNQPPADGRYGPLGVRGKGTILARALPKDFQS